MSRIRGIVVATLLAVWSFPAVSSARTPDAPAPPVERAARPARTEAASARGDTESAGLAAREARSRELQNYRGGSGVYIYAGSGVLLALVIVLLIVLLV